MENFRQALEIYSLHDLGFFGDCFTWNNRHEGNTFTKERLDRVVANSNYNQVYNWTKVENLVS